MSRLNYIVWTMIKTGNYHYKALAFKYFARISPYRKWRLNLRYDVKQFLWCTCCLSIAQLADFQSTYSPRCYSMEPLKVCLMCSWIKTETACWSPVFTYNSYGTCHEKYPHIHILSSASAHPWSSSCAIPPLPKSERDSLWIFYGM